MIKRYLVFGGDYYYPSGGWNDFQNCFDSELEAKAYADGYKSKHPEFKWVQVVDVQTQEIIYEPID